MPHLLVAVLIQACAAPVFGWWAGALAGAWFFIGREYTQAEYRLIEHHYGGLRANMPAMAPLKQKRAWTKKAVIDWVAPSALVALVAIGMDNAAL
jgi:hypothetical protein